MSLTADAAGLGRLTALSGLGEPLTAEIELLSVTPEELSSLTAAVAAEEAYAVQGIERTAIHNAIKVDVAKKADGSPFLKLTTQQPVTDPFIDMLIQVDWSTGRLLREFTVLLDPPGFSVDNGNQAAAPSAAEKSGGDAPVQQAAKPRQARSGRISKPDEVQSSDEYKTRRGDTLLQVAKQMQHEGVSLDQMLVGIYQANQGAFAGNNMNQLKVGQIIRKPGVEEVNSISQSEARREIRVHAKDWQAYKNRLAGAVAQSEASADEPAQASAGKISAQAEDKAAPPVQGPHDVVKLSKGEAEAVKADAGSDKVAQEKLNALQEEVTAGAQRLKDANERVAALEKQIQDMQKLLEVRSQAMADLQRNAAAQVAQPPAPEVAPQPAEQAKPEVSAVPQPPAEAPAKAEAAKPEKKPVVSVPQPVEEPSLLPDPMLLGLGGGAIALLVGGWLYYRNKRKRSLDSFEQGILTAGGLKANTVFGNTAGGTVDTGNTSFLTDFSQSTSGVIDTHDVDPIAEAEVYMAYGREAQAEEILKDAIQKEPRRYDLHLKLLEIYAGRNAADAFETVAGEMYAILGAADPTWHKVAEMGRKLEPENPLYETDSASLGTGLAQETASPLVSGDLSEKTAGDSSLEFPSLGDVITVSPAAESGLNAESDNSLDFELGDFSDTVAGRIEDVSADTGEVSAAALPAVDELVEQGGDLAETSDKGGLDFHLGDVSFSSDDAREFEEPAEDQAQVAVAEPSGLGYEMPDLNFAGFGAPETSPEPVPGIDGIEPDVAAIESVSAESDGLDFTLDLPDSKIDDIAEEIESIKHDLPEIDLSAISLDLNTVTAEDVGGLAPATADNEPESVNTKLDLVSVYLDMDDKEGARELLQEILKEGGEKQRERAQELLSRLA